MSRGSQLKGETQKERAAAGIVTTVAITSLDLHVTASEVMTMLASSFRKTEVDARPRSLQQAPLGTRIGTKKGTFMFLVNDGGPLPLRRMRISTADINIVAIGKEVSTDTECLLRLARQENVMFLSCFQQVDPESRKYVKKYFGKHKIYTFREAPRVLESKNILNRRQYNRPVLVADTVEFVDPQRIRVTGALSKGFVSHNVLLNGALRAKIVAVDGPRGPVCIKSLRQLSRDDLHGKKDKSETRELEEIVSRIRITERDEECVSDESLDESLGRIGEAYEPTHSSNDDGDSGQLSGHDEFNNSSSDSCQENRDAYNRMEMEVEMEKAEGEAREETSSTEMSSVSEYEVIGGPHKSTDMHERYRDYKGFRSLSLGASKSSCASPREQLRNFQQQNLPPHYAGLSFVSSDRIRKKLLEKPSPVPAKTPLSILLALDRGTAEDLNGLVIDGFLCVHGLFDYEGMDTVTCLGFDSGRPIVPEAGQDLVFDHGFFSVSPGHIVVGSGTDVVKCKREGKKGTLCFISPLVLTEDKVFIMQNNEIIGTAMQNYKQDPVLIRTVVFKGRPLKINKRSCVVGRMFSRRSDVLYFKNVKLYSSKKKEGRIKRPLGERGLMKCYFCPPVKHGERIYMELARRIFLRPPQTN